MKKGEKWYIMVHAYHHIVAEIVEQPFPKTVILKNVCRVQSCNRGWTAFFKEGFMEDTHYSLFPDGVEV